MIPQLKEIHSLYSAKGLVLLNIDVRESEKKASAFSSKYNLPYPTLLDEEGKVSQDYGIFGVPVKVLINREGRIICWNCRSLDRLLEEQFNMKTK
jgi:peroxiredoxin